MKRTTAAILAALFLFSPASAIAGDDDARQVNDEIFRRNADDYRWKASMLEGKQPQLGYRQQWVAWELIDTYYKLAETRSALGDAVESNDWTREKKLEQQFHTLKTEERQLWAEFDRLNK